MAGKAVKQLSSGGSGQSFSDRMTSAKHIIAGSGLSRAVCKATTEEIIAPKKKHLAYLIECTNQSNVSIPELANALLERLSNSNWVVVFKALVSIHSVMNYGNERFTQYLASNNCHLSLRNFYDKSSVQGADMSRFICRYSAYVQEKAFAYRSLAFDLCKAKRGSDDGALRTLSVEKLLRALPVLIGQFDALLGFDATPSEISNPIISAAFLMLYKDASRLFVIFNDGIINMLSTFFESMTRKQCRESVDIYKKFLVRSERLAEFGRVAESAGIDRADATSLERHPTSFLEAMEAHLAQLEGRRVSRSDSSNSLGSAASPQPPSTSSAASTAAAAAPAVSASSASGGFSEAQRQALLMEEQRQLDRLKAERQRRLAATQAAAASTASTATTASASAASALPPPAHTHQRQHQQQQQQQQFQQQKSSDAENLLMLDSNPASVSLTAAFSPFPPQPPPPPQPPQQSAAFSPFSTASGFSAFPPATAFPAASYSTAVTPSPAPVSAASVFDPFGGVLEPTRPGQKPAPGGGPLHHQPQQQRPGLTSDLDSSLAALAGRLDMRETGGQHGRHSMNWNSGSARTVGSAGPVPIAPGPTVNWGGAGGGGGGFGQPSFAMPQQQFALVPYAVPYAQPMGFGAAGYPAAPYGPPYASQQQQQQFGPPGQQQNGAGPSDPFGAL